MFPRASCALAIIIASLVSAHAATSPLPVAVTLDGVLDAKTDDTPVFTPDGVTAFFDRALGSRKTIMMVRRTGRRWGSPTIAPFSGQWFDQNPVVSADGSYLLFNSDRPTTEGGTSLVQSFFGSTQPGSNIWKVSLNGPKSGAATWLGLPVNDSPFVDFPALARDGSLYYLKVDQGSVHIFRSQYEPTGVYGPGVRVPLGDASVSTHDAAVDPVESFMVFDYGKVKNGLGRLCIAFRHGNLWGDPIDLGDQVNRDLPSGARLAPDGQTVYLTSATGIWRLSLASWLHEPRGPRCPSAS